MEHLTEKIVRTTVGECTKEHGHILSVNHIVEITDNKDTIFYIKFEAETLKPDEGCRLHGRVCLVFKDGIFIDVFGCQKIMIASKSMNDFKYDSEKQVFRNDKKVISAGDEIEVEITKVRYNKKKFDCLGKLV